MANYLKLEDDDDSDYDEDNYDTDSTDKSLDDDEISPEEEGFLNGYEEDMDYEDDE